MNYFRNNMSSIRSKIYFVVLTSILLSGFPNFMAQEVHAAAGITSVVTNSSTQVTITFNTDTLGTDGATVNLPGAWTVGGNTAATVTDVSGGGVSVIVLTVSAANAFATDATPTIVYTNPADATTIDSDADGVDIAVNQAAVDNAPPTFVSAETTSATTIAITFSEDVTDNSELDDFTINGAAGGSTISATSVSGSVLTLTTGGYSIVSSDTVTVTFDGEAADLEDGSAATNDVADFGPSSVTNNEIDTTGGSSGNKHNTKPTFGLDPKTHFQLIDDGFSFNGVPTDISDNYWTPYEQQSIKLGELNEFETKVFASQKLRVQEFLFGIPVVGEAHNAELGVEVHYNYAGDIENIVVVQKTNVIDVDSVQIEKIKSKCKADSSDERCVTTQLQMKFLEPLQDNVMAMKAIDFKGRSQITYLNDGFDISGDSLSPMKTMMIIGTEKYEGLIEVTQIAKYSDVWVAQDGRAFEMNEYYTPKLIEQTIEDKIDTRNNLDRYHSGFEDYKELQAKNAILQLLEYCPTCLDSFTDFDDSFGYEYPDEINKLDNPEIIQKMLLENERAQKIMNYLLDPSLKYK